MEQITENTPPGSGLTLAVNSELSLQELVTLDGQGKPVLRTPHIGNLSDGNLTTMALGLRHTISDRMLTGRDTIYHPSEIIVGGEATVIASKAANQSVTHTTASMGLASGVFEVAPGESLPDIHMRSLSAAFPNNQRAETQTDYMVRSSEAIREVVGALKDDLYYEFSRYLDADGYVRDILPEQAKQLLETRGFFSDGSERGGQEGLLLPNKLTILLDAVIEALQYESDAVYELCGQTMAHYIKKAGYQDMAKLYEVVRQRTSFGNQLPQNLRLVFVPTVDARLVVPAALGPQMDELMTSFLEHKQGEATRNKQRGQLLAQTAPERKGDVAASVSAEHRAVSAAERREIGQLALALSGLFADTDSRQQLTQYDLLDGYYLAPQLLATSMQGLKQTFKEIGKYRDQEANR